MMETTEDGMIKPRILGGKARRVHWPPALAGKFEKRIGSLV